MASLRFITHRSSILWLLPVVALGGAFGCGDDDNGSGGQGGSTSAGGKSNAGGTAGKTGAGGGAQGGSSSGGKTGSGGSAEGGTSSGGAPEAGAGGMVVPPEAGAGGVPSNGSGGAGGEMGGQGGEGGETVLPNCVRDTSNAAKLIPVSADGHDGFYGVVVDAQGNIYATGNAASGIANADNRKTVVAKFDKTGALVSGFGTAGIATVDVVAAGGGELPRGIVLQSDGKIVVAGTVEHDAAATGLKANDRDVYAVRFKTDGNLDTDFGVAGVRILNLNDGVEGTNSQGAAALLAADAQWGLSVDGTDRLLIHSAQRATGFQSDGVTPRTDTDWSIVRLTKEGAVDSSFGTAGKFTYDIGQASGSARTLTLLADGSMVASGYSTYSGVQRPVLFKLGPDGQGPLWVFSEPVGTAAEAYGAAMQQSGKFVTAGYGRPNSTATTSDFVSIRLTASGTLDTEYGQKGAVWFDVGGFGDNARSLTVLGDDRVLMVGGGRLSETDVDGIVTVLTAQGAPDVTFAPKGCRAYDFSTPGDFFWGAALSPDKKFAAVVGLTGVAASSTNDNDSTLLILPVN
ncbi:MAG: hypothetical protein ACOY0T_13115 [Myxococcota bacterium]